MTTRTLLFVLLACAASAGAAPTTTPAPPISVPNPILIIYQPTGQAGITIAATPPPGYTIDSYALLIVGAVKFVAAGYKVPDTDLWAAIERARHADAQGGIK